MPRPVGDRSELGHAPFDLSQAAPRQGFLLPHVVGGQRVDVAQEALRRLGETAEGRDDLELLSGLPPLLPGPGE